MTPEGLTTGIQQKSQKEEEWWRTGIIDDQITALANGRLLEMADVGIHYRLIGPLRRGDEPRTLRPQTVDLLEEIQQRWEEKVVSFGLPTAEIRLSITSLYRDEQLQKDLRELTFRATRGESAHLAGAAIDFDAKGYFSGAEFRPVNQNSSDFEKTYSDSLKQVLEELQTEGKCDFIDEKVCYHVCVLPKTK